jgi:hypothetical protein
MDVSKKTFYEYGSRFLYKDGDDERNLLLLQPFDAPNVFASHLESTIYTIIQMKFAADIKISLENEPKNTFSHDDNRPRHPIPSCFSEQKLPLFDAKHYHPNFAISIEL